MENSNDPKCFCCDNTAKFNIVVASGSRGSDGAKRFYIPNQTARKSESVLEKIWFCHDCMRFIEDNFRSTINYLKEEQGTAWSKKGKSIQNDS